MISSRRALALSLAVAAGLLTFAIAGADAPSTSVHFSTHLITDQLRGGYSVAIADVNHDGKLDIIPVAAELESTRSAAGRANPACYKNPGWEPHLLPNEKKARLWVSPADIDGDGI